MEFVFTSAAGDPRSADTAHEVTGSGATARVTARVAARVTARVVGGKSALATGGWVNVEGGHLSASLGQKQISGQFNMVIRLLILDATIAYTILEKPRSRLQRYRLTDKGRAAVDGSPAGSTNPRA